MFGVCTVVNMVDSWHIRVAAEPLIGRDGVRWLVIARSSERVIWVCPLAEPDELGQALAEALAEIQRLQRTLAPTPPAIRRRAV